MPGMVAALCCKTSLPASGAGGACAGRLGGGTPLAACCSPGRRAAASHHQNHLTRHLAADNIVQRVRRPLQRIPGRNTRPELAFLQPVKQLLNIGLIPLWLAGSEAPPE